MKAHVGTLTVMNLDAAPAVADVTGSDPAAWWALLVAVLALSLSGFNTWRAWSKDRGTRPRWIGTWDDGGLDVVSNSPAKHFTVVNRGNIPAQDVSLFLGATKYSLTPAQTRMAANFDEGLQGWVSFVSGDWVDDFRGSFGERISLPEGEARYSIVYARLEWVHPPNMHVVRSRTWKYKAR